MKPSLSASALKVLALFTMLLDHMAYYLYLPEPLRWVGRLAAPIFLFFVVEGFGRTRNYKKYLLRVYAVAVGMGITNALLRQYAGGLRPDGITPTNGICATFFLLLVILQGLKRMEQRRWDGILLVAGPFVLPLLLEGTVYRENLAFFGVDEPWLDDRLAEKQLTRPQVLLLLYNGKDLLIVPRQNTKGPPPKGRPGKDAV